MRIKVLILCLACCLACFAKGVQVSVADSKGKAKKGTVLELKIAQEEGKTNKEGLYAFPMVIPTDTLVVYKDSRTFGFIPLGDADTISIVLNKKTFTYTQGDSIIEESYTVKPRVRRNPNVITKEQIRMRNPRNLYELLSGSVAGVTVQAGQIIIRGVNSINCPIEPLFVIDGRRVRGSTAANAAINIFDIETVEVDKNGFEYGVEGANGVIKITTTRGNE